MPRPCMSATTERILWANNITKTHDGTTYQIKNENLTLHRGDKIAILGPNGSGKSTLLSILSGLIQPDSGQVSLRKGAIATLVSQDLPTDLSLDMTTAQAVLQLACRYSSAPDIAAALNHALAVHEVEDAMGDQREAALRKLSKVVMAMDANPAAWQVDSYLKSALNRLDIPTDIKLSKLSGGQRRRVAIASALVSRPHVLLLDEVTNHLSISGIEFLEEVLSDSSLTVVIISHDRMFVDKVCTTAIWELDGTLHRYSPGYNMFLGEKADRLSSESKMFHNMTKALKKELLWLNKQPRARGTKNKSRVQEAHTLQQAVQDQKSKHKGRTTSVGRLQAGNTRMGSEVVTLSDVTIKRGENTVIEDFSYCFERGERVGIIGGNGVGKSSLLKAIAGELSITSGEIRIGDTVVIGHFQQEGIDLSKSLSDASAVMLGARSVEDMRVMDYVKELVSMFGTKGRSNSSGAAMASSTGESDGETRVDQELEALSYSIAQPINNRKENTGNSLTRMTPVALMSEFGFSREKQHAPLGQLSGGERRRLQLMALLLQNANFLMLDEVSNDLDVNTLTMVEEVLVDYDGVLILCSHDRFMLDRLVDHLLVVVGDGSVELVEGKFTDYLAKKKISEEEAKRQNVILESEDGGNDSKDVKQQENLKPSRKKLSFKERKEYERLEKEIDKCQLEYDQLSEKLSNEGGQADYKDISEWSEHLAELEEAIEVKLQRWIHLSEMHK